MSLAEYEEFVFGAGLLNEPDPVAAWKKVSRRQQNLADLLNGKSDYHVVAANGTDIRMSVAGKKWINCDGHENFPDGEVFTGPVIDSAEGVVHFSFPAVHGGREVQDVRLKFKTGKVVDASAAKGEEFLISMLDMDAGSRFLASAPSARTTTSPSTPRTPCSTRRSAGRCISRWGRDIRKPAIPIKADCIGTWWWICGQEDTWRSTGKKLAKTGDLRKEFPR